MATKREKFIGLAEARVNKALKGLQLVGNLSNRTAYDYTDEDIKKMFRALQHGLDSAKQRFADAGNNARGSFSLQDSKQ